MRRDWEGGKRRISEKRKLKGFYELEKRVSKLRMWEKKGRGGGVCAHEWGRGEGAKGEEGEGGCDGK